MTDAPPAAAAAHETPRVFLGTPYYGPVAMGWHHSIGGAVKDRSLLHVAVEMQANSSVLPHAFNELLAHALDARDAGQITHFAMCHSDIWAPRGWLDALWSEMWTAGADVVAAVVPIKALNGRTSTAVGDEADPWAVRRCVWLKDRATLPPTFGPASVCQPGEVLLVNTGLFLADLRRPWWDDFAFSFHTRIDRDPATGRRHPRHRSEDWEMSHHLHRAGATVMATWKVKLRHEGALRFPNYPEDE